MKKYRSFAGSFADLKNDGEYFVQLLKSKFLISLKLIITGKLVSFEKGWSVMKTSKLILRLMQKRHEFSGYH